MPTAQARTTRRTDDRRVQKKRNTKSPACTQRLHGACMVLRGRHTKRGCTGKDGRVDNLHVQRGHVGTLTRRTRWQGPRDLTRTAWEYERAWERTPHNTSQNQLAMGSNPEGVKTSFGVRRYTQAARQWACKFEIERTASKPLMMSARRIAQSAGVCTGVSHLPSAVGYTVRSEWSLQTGPPCTAKVAEAQRPTRNSSTCTRLALAGGARGSECGVMVRMRRASLSGTIATGWKFAVRGQPCG